MIIARIDIEILRTKEMQDLHDLYEAKFGKHFAPFTARMPCRMSLFLMPSIGKSFKKFSPYVDTPRLPEK